MVLCSAFERPNHVCLSLQLAYCVVQFMEKDATVTEYVRLFFVTNEKYSYLLNVHIGKKHHDWYRGEERLKLKNAICRI